tara:strand:+ start:166 stop:840 length:675 start_codon:yes stop_codon:yes gene_type:complete
MTKSIIDLKSDIKVISAQQKILKDQRKVQHNKLPRTIEPWQARWDHMNNRWRLRHMFYVYAELQGKDPNIAFASKKDDWDFDPKFLNGLRFEYGNEVVRVSAYWWNHMYTEFREIASTWVDGYREKLSAKEALIIWFYDYFIGWSFDTHSARPVRIVDGWYDASVTDPDHNVGIIGFIPDEDDHVTSVMLDHDDVWVKLDNYDVIPEETKVTYWRPLPSTENLK